MTNEQLSNVIRNVFSFMAIRYEAHSVTYIEARETLLALIDRQPSEEHLKLINMVLSQINSREMWATRADYEMARMALDRIRTALCLEGKE